MTVAKLRVCDEHSLEQRSGSPRPKTRCRCARSSAEGQQATTCVVCIKIKKMSMCCYVGVRWQHRASGSGSSVPSNEVPPGCLRVAVVYLMLYVLYIRFNILLD